MQQYEEIELDSSRATTCYNSNHFGGDIEPVIVKLKFVENDMIVEVPIEGRACFEKTVKELKQE